MVLRREQDQEFDVGIIDGPRGKARIRQRTADALELTFRWTGTPPPLYPLTMLIGITRPVVMKRLLKDLTTIGVGRLLFCGTDKGETSYRQSRLWRDEGYHAYLIDGAQQAFGTRLPVVEIADSLAAALQKEAIPRTANRENRNDPPLRLVLDNYESPVSISAALKNSTPPGFAAIGPERGWSARERELFREQGFRFVHLGKRVLRTETACIAAAMFCTAGMQIREIH